MGFREKLQQQAMQRVTPSDTAVGQQLATILTTTEWELFQAVNRLVEAADAGEFQVSQTIEDRRDEILAVADAVAAQEFEDWWWTHYGDDLVDDPADARALTDLTKQEWHDQMATWAENYRASLPDDHAVQDMTDAEVANFHTQEKFGVDLATFAREVVEWHAAEHVEEIVRSNLRFSVTTIHLVADHLENQPQDTTKT